MEIVYSSAGHQTMHIGARLPFEGESLESVVKMFAPVSLWIERAMSVVAPTVGASGSVAVQLAPDAAEPQQQTEFTIPIDVVGGA